MKSGGLCLEAGDTPFEMIPDIDTEAAILGYIETEEQEELYQRMVDLGLNGRDEELFELYKDYDAIAFKQVDKLQGEDYRKINIGVLIQKAKLFKKVGFFDRCWAELNEARYVAEQYSSPELADRINSIMDDAEREFENRN